MEKNKTVVCKNCNTTILKKEKVCPNCGKSTKKPFYKKGWFIGIVVVLVLIILSPGNSSNSEKIEWSAFELSSVLPEIDTNKGRVLTDSERTLNVYICNITNEEYKEYVDKCKDKGFTVESKKDGNDFEAFNNDGYKLSLWHNESDEELHIQLSVPRELKEMEWPTTGLAALAPEPQSSIGKVERDDSEYFNVYVGNMDIDSFTDYVEQCQDEGFDIDYSKREKYFSAKNEDNYKIYVEYVGFNTIEVTIELVEEKEVENTSVENNEESTSENKDEEQFDGVLRPEFKQAMDSYEEFMNEYVEFMKKYEKSNGEDLSILADYANYMNKYAKFVEDFDKWEDEEMNTAETAYYTQVQSRVSQKLLEIAY